MAGRINELGNALLLICKSVKEEEELFSQDNLN
jgi:hypothetical protein